MENAAPESIVKVYFYSLKNQQYDLAKYDENLSAIENKTSFNQKLTELQTSLKMLKRIDIQKFKVNMISQSCS